ncbi:MAG: rubrerythrin family protein, partial [Deltaproteobacteria bacterium]|nr:rubrerythrin family protein [Deltaproteobacteria bacterium]
MKQDFSPAWLDYNLPVEVAKNKRLVKRMDIKEALSQAYTGEAKAALRLKVYAQKAEDEGYKQMAKLFRVIAFSEEIHG